MNRKCGFGRGIRKRDDESDSATIARDERRVQHERRLVAFGKLEDSTKLIDAIDQTLNRLIERSEDLPDP